MRRAESGKALNLSAGIVLQPVKDLSLALDWFALNQRDTIQLLDAQYLIDNEDHIRALLQWSCAIRVILCWKRNFRG
jgi:hypothetical protein